MLVIEKDENKLLQEINLSEIIHIPDKSLEQAIRRSLYLFWGDITIGDMLKLKRLEGAYSGISSLNGLEYAQNLEVVNLDWNEITDLTPLRYMDRLENISIRN